MEFKMQKELLVVLVWKDSLKKLERQKKKGFLMKTVKMKVSSYQI